VPTCERPAISQGAEVHGLRRDALRIEPPRVEIGTADICRLLEMGDFYTVMPSTVMPSGL
jgi:hypothetical protein